MHEAVTVVTTVTTSQDAERLAEAIVVERLAACAQITTVRSRYVWKGEVERQDEQLITFKTRFDLFEPLRARLRELHPYETPEIIALPVVAADADYLAWLAEATGPS